MFFLKYIIFILFTLILLIFGSFYFYFNAYSNYIIENEKNISTIYIDKFISSSSELILNNKYLKLQNNLNNLAKTNLFTNIELLRTNYYITNKSIIIHSNQNIDQQWQLNDISIDSKFGKLKKIFGTIYRVYPSMNYDFETNLIVKSQATDMNEIKNIISNIDFNLPQYKFNITSKNNDILMNVIKKYVKIDEKKYIKSFYINNKIEFAKIKYSINNELIYNKIYKHINKFLEYILTVFTIFTIIYIIFNYLMLQNTINRYIKKLNLYTNDIINNNFYKFDSKKLVFKNLVNVANNISLISKKMATIINELNVNKNILDLKVSSDNLTQLPSNKIFEQDMKSLFLSKSNANIIKIKLECLKDISINTSNLKIDNLILSFVSNTKKAIHNSNLENNITLYRIYGSEFIIIAKNLKFDEINKILDNISNLNLNLKEKYNIKGKIAHMVSIPFDYHSSTISILEDIDKLYNKTIINPKQISFHSQDNKKLDEEHKKLEQIVSSIISNSAFTISYKFDTFSYDDNKLIMQEVSPDLLNIDGSIIPIGSFISIAQENNIAIDFDKEVIIKSFKYIQQNNIKHKIAINISIDSLCSNEFIIWLESQLLYDYKDICSIAVFSITSFAAKNNFDDFISFINQIKRFNGQVLLKRFSYNDFDLSQLEQINVNYIRVHKDYTNNIDKHKKNILSNISNYCISSNIIILSDLVSNENDNLLLKSIGFYGTSKE